MTESRQVRRAQERAAAKSPRLFETHPLGNRAARAHRGALNKRRARNLMLAHPTKRHAPHSLRRVVTQALLSHLQQLIADRMEKRRAVAAIAAFASASLPV